MKSPHIVTVTEYRVNGVFVEPKKLHCRVIAIDRDKYLVERMDHLAFDGDGHKQKWMRSEDCV